MDWKNSTGFCQKIVDDLFVGGEGRPIEISKSSSIVDKSFWGGATSLWWERLTDSDADQLS